MHWADKPPIVWLMAKSVSVAEKTLEHWSSQYITYRYRSKVALWWPTTGEDINVRWLPPRSGKALQLELKTTTVIRPGVHDVIVDLGQLWEYRQRPLGHQPFYAFPRPDPYWSGNLEAAAFAEGRAVTELGFARSGHGWWFADWMIVMTSEEVAAVLHQELRAHGSRKRKRPVRLVRFDRNQSKPVWGAGTSHIPETVDWLEFWPTIEDCGRDGWPQLIRLPAVLVRAQGPYSSEHVAGMLREAADLLATEGETNVPLVTLEPNADGSYQVTPATSDNLGGSDEDAIDEEDRNGEPSDHRQIVFLDARTLLRTR